MSKSSTAPTPRRFDGGAGSLPHSRNRVDQRHLRTGEPDGVADRGRLGTVGVRGEDFGVARGVHFRESLGCLRELARVVGHPRPRIAATSATSDTARAAIERMKAMISMGFLP